MSLYLARVCWNTNGWSRPSGVAANAEGEAKGSTPTFVSEHGYGHEEWLYVVAGEPTLRSPEGERTLQPGDTVCFPAGPEGAHDVRGPGRVLLFSANRWPEVVVYPDSDKLGARPAPWPAHIQDRGNFRRSDAVDYWDGED